MATTVASHCVTESSLSVDTALREVFLPLLEVVLH